MSVVRRFLSWIDGGGLPRPVNYLCVACGFEARLLEKQGRPKCRKCGNHMVRLDD